MANREALWISCPLQGCEGCSGGNGKGLTKKYFIDHLNMRHFKTDALKVSYKDRVSKNYALFSVLDQALHAAGVWLCGVCFCTYTFNKNCKHADGEVVLAPSFHDVAIYGITAPPTPVLDTVNGAIVASDITDGGIGGEADPLITSQDGGTVFDINLLSRVFLKK